MYLYKVFLLPKIARLLRNFKLNFFIHEPFIACLPSYYQKTVNKIICSNNKEILTICYKAIVRGPREGARVTTSPRSEAEGGEGRIS